ncbi:MAG: NPCBM/NEW2 domain-containing protein, partial [Planctomycetes bacterium]|nr:NPCBM/NEW2 domain-containing protein [Planctomycetota bacterium]
WSGAYYRIDGKTYKNAVAMTCPGKAVYGCKENYRRFVALIGVREDAGESAAIVFEVFAGTRKLYTSPPLTKHSTPVGIDVSIPGRTKEIRLVTSGSSSEGHHWAGWVNAGFLMRDERPRVGYVTLPVPGFDPAQYEVAVFAVEGGRVPGVRLATPEEGKIDQLFFGGQGWLTYYAYLVAKDKFEPGPQDWLPNAGVVLETRRVDKGGQRACEDLPGLVKVWNEAGAPVGRSLVAGIHHGSPVHPRLLETGDKTAKDSLALYRYTGFFEADRAGEYLFATASNWGSHLLVDDKPVVSWPGSHNYRDGITGQKQGKVVLQPGVHKLDYFNYSPWGTMFTLAAWQPPGGKLGVMAGSDFPATRGFVVTGVEYNPAADKKLSFEWDVVDDWRLDHDKIALVRMRFRAFPDRRAEDRGQKTEDGGRKTDGAPSTDFRWTFEDGVIKMGRAVERVFLDCGKHAITVQMIKGAQVLAETKQVVYAGARADKMWVEPRDPKAFQQEIAQTDLRKAPIQDVVRLHVIGNDLPEPVWKKTAVQVLLERVDELMARPEYQPLCLELGQHLSSAAVQQYDQALSLYTKLQEKTREGTPLRQQTMVAAGELLLRCLGRPDAALRLLNQARWEKAQDKTWTVRLGLARAEALLALGDTKELEAQMRQLQELQGKQDPRRQDLRRAGLLDQAAFLAGQKTDPAQWEYAMNNVETILREEPDQVLSPEFNLVRLDVHLARGEYRIARHLAERLAKLDLTPYDRAQVFVRHIKALCALGDPDSARKVLEQLTQVYPNSEQAAQARAMVVEAATKARKQ